MFVLTFYATLFFVLAGSTNGVNLLVYSELAWSTIYCMYATAGYVLDAAVFLSLTLPILVLASVDCGTWLLLLVYFNYFSRVGGQLDIVYASKFAFRVSRLLQTNRFLK